MKQDQIVKMLIDVSMVMRDNALTGPFDKKRAILKAICLLGGTPVIIARALDITECKARSMLDYDLSIDYKYTSDLLELFELLYFEACKLHNRRVDCKGVEYEQFSSVLEYSRVLYNVYIGG